MWQTDSNIIGGLFSDYFAGLFTSTGGLLMNRILSLVAPSVSEETNATPAFIQ